MESVFGNDDNKPDGGSEESGERSDAGRTAVEPDDFFGKPDGGDAAFQRNEDGSVKRNKDGTPKRKPGRKPGSKAKSQKARTIRAAAQSGAIESVASALSGIHWVVAIVFDAKEFQMSDEQALKVAHSVDRVLRAYEVPRNEKVESVIELSTVLGGFYLGSAIKYNTRKTLEQKQKRQQADKQPQPQNVSVFKPVDKGPINGDGGPGNGVA